MIKSVGGQTFSGFDGSHAVPACPGRGTLERALRNVENEALGGGLCYE
jgi:hypothetical protein